MVNLLVILQSLSLFYACKQAVDSWLGTWCGVCLVGRRLSPLPNYIWTAAAAAAFWDDKEMRWTGSSEETGGKGDKKIRAAEKRIKGTKKDVDQLSSAQLSCIVDDNWLKVRTPHTYIHIRQTYTSLLLASSLLCFFPVLFNSVSLERSLHAASSIVGIVSARKDTRFRHTISYTGSTIVLLP